ncbi:hypothetical protein [Streptomyces sp. Ac-502]|uniref:hypothetical protein n=1 Tax=Streptomyces sp. Ac-502 TaxID=3342801 RepID=UPI0038625E03
MPWRAAPADPQNDKGYDTRHPPACRSPDLLKAVLAGVGGVFFLVAVLRPAPWSYAVGAVLLTTSGLVHSRCQPPR